jgi:hypothetical protein
MTIPNYNLRLYLGFLHGLKQVEVLAATNQIGSQLRIMGFVEGKEKLENLLGAAGIDHYVICSGEPGTASFTATAFEMNPGPMTESLEKEFRREDELLMKILEGHSLTEEEKHFSPRTTLTVCSSYVQSQDGLNRIQSWFSAQKS